MTKRFKFEKECTENFFTEKGVFYNNERPMGANEIIVLLNSLYDENEQLRILLNEAEDMIETRLTEYYIKQYKNIKKGILDE